MKLLGYTLDLLGRQVGNKYFRIFLHQKLHKVHSYLAHTLNGNAFSLEAIASEYLFGGSFHSHIYTVCRHRGGIASTTHRLGKSRDMSGFHGDVFHVGRLHVYVLRRDIFSVETVDEFSEA